MRRRDIYARMAKRLVEGHGQRSAPARRAHAGPARGEGCGHAGEDASPRPHRVVRRLTTGRSLILNPARWNGGWSTEWTISRFERAASRRQGGRAMKTNHTSHVYVGLAGETGSGRTVKSGLYRMAVGDDRWELADSRPADAPAIRAIATHPQRPEIVYVGTQHGPYRSTDCGERWERLDIPDHGLPVWSLLFDPRDPRRALRRLRELRDLSERGRRRALAAAAGDRPLPGGDGGPRGQPGQACAEAGRQPRRTRTRSTVRSRSAASSAASTAASTGRT